MKHVGSLVALCCTVGLMACAGSDGDGSPTLSDGAGRGRRVAASNGCSACHGSDGEDRVASSWEGLYGSQVVLVDGARVVADDDYLTRAIAEPGAEIAAGYTLKMPTNGLSDDEIADVVAYIRELGGPAASAGTTQATSGTARRTTAWSGTSRAGARSADVNEPRAQPGSPRPARP